MVTSKEAVFLIAAMLTNASHPHTRNFSDDNSANGHGAPRILFARKPSRVNNLVIRTTGNKETTSHRSTTRSCADCPW